MQLYQQCNSKQERLRKKVFVGPEIWRKWNHFSFIVLGNPSQKNKVKLEKKSKLGGREVISTLSITNFSKIAQNAQKNIINTELFFSIVGDSSDT